MKKLIIILFFFGFSNLYALEIKLEKIADGNATKIFLPAELSATLGSIGAISELFKDDKENKEESKELTDE